MDDWTVVHTFAWPAEAALCQSALEAHGIPCMLGNEIAMSIAFGETAGGVNVKVRVCDAERALEIIRGDAENETKT